MLSCAEQTAAARARRRSGSVLRNAFPADNLVGNEAGRVRGTLRFSGCTSGRETSMARNVAESECIATADRPAAKAAEYSASDN